MPTFSQRINDLKLAMSELNRLMDEKYGEDSRKFVKHISECEDCRESLLLQKSKKFNEGPTPECGEAILLQANTSGMYDQMNIIKGRFHGLNNALQLFNDTNFLGE